jgi:hypothetical protein
MDTRRLPGTGVLKKIYCKVAGTSGPPTGGARSLIDKCSWQIICTSHKPLVLTYEVYMADSSVTSRLAGLARHRGTDLLLRVEDQEATHHMN